MTVLGQSLVSAEYLYIKDPSQINYKLIHMVKTEQEDDDSEEDGL